MKKKLLIVFSMFLLVFALGTVFSNQSIAKKKYNYKYINKQYCKNKKTGKKKKHKGTKKKPRTCKYCGAKRSKNKKVQPDCDGSVKRIYVWSKR